MKKPYITQDQRKYCHKDDIKLNIELTKLMRAISRTYPFVKFDCFVRWLNKKLVSKTTKIY